MNRLLIGILSLTAMLSASVTNPSPIPEPSTYLMMGAGLGALIYVRSRMAKKK
jgi:hypothetical protein